MFLSLALGLYLPPSEPVGYRDLRSLSAPQLQTTLDRLPKSEGQVLLISAFGSWQTWTQTATRQAAITHLSPVITLAHQKGYVVVTERPTLLTLSSSRTNFREVRSSFVVRHLARATCKKLA